VEGVGVGRKKEKREGEKRSSFFTKRENLSVLLLHSHCEREKAGERAPSKASLLPLSLALVNRHA
jgi:hypothetical protein